MLTLSGVTLTISILCTLIGLLALVYSRFRLALSRRRYRAIGLFLFYPGLLATLYALANDMFSQPEALGVAGIVVSYVVGIYGKRLDPLGKYKTVVGVVIPSRVPFHTEIRSGLDPFLDERYFDKIDNALKSVAPVDDIHSFPGLLTDTMESRPDYLILWPPGPDAASSNVVLEAVEKMSKKGGEVIFLQNFPNDRTGKSRYYVIKHDVSVGSRLLCKTLVKEYKGQDVKFIFILGPKWSGPGPESATIKKKIFSGKYDRIFVQLKNWSSKEAIEKVCAHCRDPEKRLVVVCANDDIAVSLSHWVFAESGIEPNMIDIIGYDGTQAAFSAIAEPCNPMKYTLAIRPSEYGRQAGKLVNKLFKLTPNTIHHSANNQIEILPINETFVIDQHSAQKSTYWYGMS